MTRDELTERFSLKPVRLDPPGLFVRRMTAGEVAEFHGRAKALGKDADEPTVVALLWAYTVSDADGGRPFGPDDVARVRDFDPVALSAVANWAGEQNGIAPGADPGKAPSPAGRTSSSRSGSRSRSGGRSAKS